MSTAQDFNRLYSDIASNISAAMTDMGELKVDNEEGKQQLSNMMQKLQAIQGKFQNELEFLEQHAEWEKFTIAFFGETNSGKSTIIESLRILFKEESRQKLLEESQNDLEKFSEAVREHAENAREGLARVAGQHAADIEAVRSDATQLGEILRKERDERLRITESETSARVRRKLGAAALVGVLAGAGAASLVLAVMGG